MRIHQAATYWPKGTRNGYGGIDYSSPQAIMVRWEDKSSLFVDSFGEEATSKAVVYCDKPLDCEGYLLLGDSTETDPTGVAGAYKIRNVSITPNLKNTAQQVKIWL